MKSVTKWDVFRYLALTLFSIPWIVIPIWLVVVNSFKTAGDAARLTLALPQTWHMIENYRTVIVDGVYFRALLNTVLVTVPTIAVVVFAGSAAAWAFGRTRSKLMLSAYYMLAMSILISPAVIPTIFLLQTMNVNGTMFGYVMVLIGTRIGLVVFLATGFIRSLPTDLEDAALIDGASTFQIYRIIILPLLAPVLFTGSIILVISVWTDFFLALLILQGRANETLSLSLFSFAQTSSYTVNWSLVFAHVVLVSVPLFVAYVFLQRRIMGGLTEGAIKG